MSSTLRADDIFNLEDDRDRSEDSEEESERKTTANTFASTKGARRALPKGRNAVVFGLEDAEDSEDDRDDENDQDTFSQEEKEQGNSGTVQLELGTSVDPSFTTEDDDNGTTKPPRLRDTKKSKKVKPLTPEALEKFQATRDKTGIVYLSKIPPFMKPIKLRHLLGKFGEVGRVYLAPEGKFQRMAKIMDGIHTVGPHTKEAR